MSFDPVSLLKLFGQGAIEREFSNLLHKHVSTTGFKALADKFAAAQKGCQDGDPDEVATALTDALFSIH